MRTYLFFLCYLPLGLWAQTVEINEQNISTSIQQVKIHLQGAEIIRSHQLQLSPGSYNLVFNGLSPKLYEETIQFKADEKLQIRSISSKLNYLNRRQANQQIKAIKDSLEWVKDSIFQFYNEKEALNSAVQLLNKNQQLSSIQHEPSGTNDLAQALDFYQQRMLRYSTAINQLDKRLEKLHRSYLDLHLQLLELNNGNQPTAEISLQVEVRQAINIPVELSYIVGDAGWSAIYDLRAGDISKDAQLTYRARAYNNTGVDWENVQLILSTADPIQSITQPEIQVWELGKRSEYQMEKIATTNIEQTIETQDLNPYRGNVFEDTKRGKITVVTEIDHRQQVNIGFVKELIGEVFNPNYDYYTPRYRQYMEQQKGAAAPTVGLTTVELPDLSTDFEIEKPYNIPSDKKPYSITIKKQKLPASYGYYAVPKMDRDAFLIAKLLDWEDLELISGPVNIYNTNTYMGQSYINIAQLDDTLNLSLGRDPKIKMERIKVEGSSKKKFLGTHKKITLVYDIRVENKQSEPVNLLIEDQIPTSTDKNVNINLLESSNAEVDEQQGILSWNLQLKPGEKQSLRFSYSIKYPKGQKVQINFSRRRVYGCPVW